MLCNVLLVSAIWQCESAICIDISPPSSASLPHTHSHPTPLGHHRATAELPVLHSSFPLAIHFTHGSVYVNVTLSVCPPLFLPLCRQLRSLHLRLYSWAASFYAGGCEDPKKNLPQIYRIVVTHGNTAED